MFYLMQYSISNLNAFIILVTLGFSYVRRFAFITLAIEMVIVVDRLCKSASLPKTEMVEGPEHASKVDAGIGPIKSYSHPQDSVSHDAVCCPSRA